MPRRIKYFRVSYTKRNEKMEEIMKFTDNIRTYFEAHQAEALELLCTLAKIPAPSNHEEQRARFCRDWLTSQGATGVYTDSALNVIYPIGDISGSVSVFMAHSDVVFPDTDPLPLEIAHGRIKCPGIGDDTANVTAVLMCAKYIAENRLTKKDGGVLLVINSGEEGLGNLKGVRKITESFTGRIRELISFDAMSAHGVNKAVGSRRYCITVKTEGGHSYNAFGKTNAIAVLSDIIGKFYAQPLPTLGKTTFNVGTVSGGTSVNTIAQQAEMLYEFRSDRRISLEEMQKNMDRIIASFADMDANISIVLVGERPCGAEVDENRQAELIKKAEAAYLHSFGRDIIWGSGSTDCNIPLSMGIPAVCIGCCIGSGAHTRDEYIEADSLLPGICTAAELILGEL